MGKKAMKTINWFKKLYKDRFKRYLVVALIIIGFFLIVKDYSSKQQQYDDELTIHFFYHPQCPHCKEQKPFNEILMEKYPAVRFVYHDVTQPQESTLFLKFAERYNIPRAQLGVPGTFFGAYHFIGFDSAETSGVQIEEALRLYINSVEKPTPKPKAEQKTIVKIPFIGDINTLDYSLPVLTIILGLVDGFNPCAMWVLVYLISIVLGLNDRRKIWLLVGTFVLASGVLYFLFMTAWLNVFLFIGYLNPLTIAIGLWAVYAGITNIRDYIKTKGAFVCEVDFGKSRLSMSKIQKLVSSPITIATIFGIIGLAFVINSIEFACSSAIPAIFTQVLALSNLSTFQYYAYILLYDLFFMLDDLIIFSLAAFAVSTTLSTKYAKYCKLIGGIVLLILGLILVFAPQSLM